MVEMMGSEEAEGEHWSEMARMTESRFMAWMGGTRAEQEKRACLWERDLGRKDLAMALMLALWYVGIKDPTKRS